MLLSSAILIAATAGYIWHSLTTCLAVPITDATQMVMEELRHRGLDAKYLSKASESECSVSFRYTSPKADLSFAVIDDPLHGPELHYYDNSQDRK